MCAWWQSPGGLAYANRPATVTSTDFPSPLSTLRSPPTIPTGFTGDAALGSWPVLTGVAHLHAIVTQKQQFGYGKRPWR